MTNRNFDEWLSKFRPSISSYDYYIDFEKVVRNVEEIKMLQCIFRNKRVVKESYIYVRTFKVRQHKT